MTGKMTFPSLLGENLEIVGDQVYWEGRPLRDRKGNVIPGIDAPSFRWLGGRFYADDHRVYVQAQSGSKVVHVYFDVLEKADRGSFAVIGDYYGVDRRNAYYLDRAVIKTSRPAEFRVLFTDHNAGRIATDGVSVYFYGKDLAGADPGTFEELGEEYFADKHSVFYNDRKIERADRASFIVASDVFPLQRAATDRFRPYRFGEAEPCTSMRDRWTPFFSARPELTGYWWHKEQKRLTEGIEHRDLGDGYSTDGERIYLKGVSLDEVDPRTFRNLGHSFITDRRGLYSFSVYHGGFLDGGLLEGGDPESLRSIGYGYFKDRNQAYHYQWKGYACPFKADVETLVALGENYAKDLNAVYYGVTRKRDIDPGTMVALNKNYVRDRNGVYFLGKRLKHEIDPMSCEAVHDYYVRDGKGRLFVEARPVRKTIDGRRLEFLSGDFARDGEHVYLVTRARGLVEIEGADRDTFRIMGERTAVDRHRSYDAARFLQDNLK